MSQRALAPALESPWRAHHPETTKGHRCRCCRGENAETIRPVCTVTGTPASTSSGTVNIDPPPATVLMMPAITPPPANNNISHHVTRVHPTGHVRSRGASSFSSHPTDAVDDVDAAAPMTQRYFKLQKTTPERNIGRTRMPAKCWGR